MTTTQKIIKYLALAFAIFLSVSIIGGIVAGVAGFAGLSFLFGAEDVAGESRSYAVSSDIQSLELDVSAANIRIVSGAEFYVESNHKYLSVSDENGVLCVEESKRIYHADLADVMLTVTVPADCVFASVKLTTGAGVLTVDSLSAQTLALELGAGQVTIGSLTASREARIQGGAGAVTISGGSLSNLDMDMGVGEVNLKSRLTGECDLEYGVGEANLTLLGSLDDYTISFDKGLGDGKLEGTAMADDSVHGRGSTRVDIEGGIGAVKIEFE